MQSFGRGRTLVAATAAATLVVGALAWSYMGRAQERKRQAVTDFLKTYARNLFPTYLRLARMLKAAREKKPDLPEAARDFIVANSGVPAEIGTVQRRVVRDNPDIAGTALLALGAPDSEAFRQFASEFEAMEADALEGILPVLPKLAAYPSLPEAIVLEILQEIFAVRHRVALGRIVQYVVSNESAEEVEETKIGQVMEESSRVAEKEVLVKYGEAFGGLPAFQAALAQHSRQDSFRDKRAELEKRHLDALLIDLGSLGGPEKE